MQREYPEIIECEREPHAVQFLPDCYLYGELTLKVIYYIPLKSIINICLGSISTLMKSLLKNKKM